MPLICTDIPTCPPNATLLANFTCECASGFYASSVDPLVCTEIPVCPS